MSKGRILIATYAFPPEEGGVSMAAYEMACDLKSLGWDIHVITQATHLPKASNLPSYYPVTTIPDSLTEDSERLKEYLNTLLKEVQPDVIIYHAWADWCREELLNVAQKINIPFILRSHGVASNFRSFFRWDYPPCFGMKKWLCSFFKIRRNILSICKKSPLNHIVFLDPYGSLFKSFDYFYASKNNIPGYTYIPNTFSAIKTKTPFFKEKYRLNSALVFTYIASACNRKQQLLFIRHVKRIKLKNIIFLFLVPHHNSYAAQMEQAIENDPRFRILYNLPRQEIEAAITESDAVFLYSFQEQQPLCILEAMSCGTPWFAPNVGAISTLKGGIVLQKTSTSCLRKAVKSLQNKAKREQLGQEGLNLWKTRYAPEVVYKQWEKLLSSFSRH